MVRGPGFEKLKNLYTSAEGVNGDGLGDVHLPQEKYQTPKILRNAPARTHSTRPSLELTAFGFPTLHPHYPHHDLDKHDIWSQAGVPGAYCGTRHTGIVENEKLIGKEHHLINVYKIYTSRKGAGGKATGEIGGRRATLLQPAVPLTKHSRPGEEGGRQRAPVAPLRNEVQKVDAAFRENREGYGARNCYEGFNEKVGDRAPKEPPAFRDAPIIIEADEMDERLMQFTGRRRGFAGRGPLAYLHQTRQEKWLAQKRRVPAAPGESSRTDERQRQREQIAVAKNLFLIWDSDGAGSLSPSELIRAFVRIGLSQDHHFAKKILHSIRPQTKSYVAEEDLEIRLKDFISIFRNDEVSDNVIKKINEEIAFNQRRSQKKQAQAPEVLAKNLALQLFGTGGDYDGATAHTGTQHSLSISMRSGAHELNPNANQEDAAGAKNSRGEIVVEIPLDERR